MDFEEGNERGSERTSEGSSEDLMAYTADGADRDDSEAPIYSIPSRLLGAVEVPAIVKNLDRCEKAFGLVNLNWEQVGAARSSPRSYSRHPQLLNPKKNSIPFYLNPDSPFRRPITSHNASTHNVLLKVTVPKRTGRKRKRGSDDPFEGQADTASGGIPAQDGEKVYSQARLDDPRVLRRKLQDNVDKYQTEAVGIIRHTHRFRGTTLSPTL
jgi:general transcription factor 3C polypeptide 5 (transcription factor C subunit 1)